HEPPLLRQPPDRPRLGTEQPVRLAPAARRADQSAQSDVNHSLTPSPPAKREAQSLTRRCQNGTLGLGATSTKSNNNPKALRRLSSRAERVARQRRSGLIRPCPGASKTSSTA